MKTSIKRIQTVSKKIISHSLWLVSCYALISTSHASSWQHTGGPIGGLGYDIRMDKNNPNTMFVTDNFSGVLKSSDRGANWQASNEGILGNYAGLGEDVNIFSLTIDPNNSNIIWAGTRSSGAFGVFKSTDAGVSWSRKENGLTASLEGHASSNLIFRGFTVELGNSNTVYAQAELSTNTQGKTFQKVHGRVFKSTDGGENWNTIWTGNHLARYLIVDPSNTNTLYLSTGIFDVEAADANCVSNNIGDWGGEGILKSTDAGANWININTGLLDLYVGSLKMHPTNSNILIAGTSSNDACQSFPPDSTMVGGLYITTDAGANWTRLLETMISAVAFDPSNANIFYGAFEDGVWRTQDGGNTFTLYQKNNQRYGPQGINAGIPIDLIVDLDHPNTLYANNYGGGVFKSDDSAQTWENWSNGYSGATIAQMATHPSDDSLILASGLSGAFVSQHYGLNWQGLAFGSLGNSAQTSAIAIHPNNKNIILVADAFDGTLHRSTDAGQTFSQVLKHSATQTLSFNRVMFAPNSDTVYATIARNNNRVMDNLVIYKSINSGETFAQISHNMAHANLAISDLHVMDENTFYLATTDSDPGDDSHDGSLFKTTNGGGNLWAIRENTNIGAVLHSREGTVIAGDFYTGIWRSSDAQAIPVGTSANWTKASSIPLTEPYSTDLIQHPTSTQVYLSTIEGIFTSNDYNTWSEFPTNLTGLDKYNSQSLAISNNALYVGSHGGGVFRYDIRQAQTSPTIGQFSAVTNAAQNVWIESSTLTLMGLENAGTQALSINNGQYSINGGPFTSGDTVIEHLDTINVRVKTSIEFSTQTQASVAIEHLNQDLLFSVITQTQDTLPDNFNFNEIIDAQLSTLYTSESIQISGINSSAEIGINNGQYQINDGEYSSTPGLVENDDTIRVQVMSASSFNQTTTAILTIGGVQNSFNVLSQAQDTTPDSFNFGAIINAELTSSLTSNSITVSGINSEVSIRIEGGLYQINDGDFNDSNSLVKNGDTVSVMLESASEYNTQNSAHLTIGTSQQAFSVTTRSEPVSNTTKGSSGGALWYLLCLLPFLLRKSSRD